MKGLWLHIVRAYLRVGLFFYFKKIEVANAKVVPESGPVLFLANHQNALLDALLIATTTKRFSYFLTRASVFNKPIVSKVLQSLQMLPVYRVRDGWSNLSKNNSIFTKSSKLLNDGEAIVIFPEGSHNIKRTIRPLSKGFTRIVFETLHTFPDIKIYVIPVGLSFQHAEKFSDSTLINFGKPIEVDDKLLHDKNQSILQLKDEVSHQLRQLTVHIEGDNYEAVLEKLKSLQVDFTKPEDVNECISKDFTSCKKKQVNKYIVLKRLAKALLIIHLIVPYAIWKKGVQPKIKEVEFTSTFRFTIAITLVPIFMIVILLILAMTLHIKFAMLYILTVFVLALLAVKL
ncbi:lysophospholipid acyltransferase family protein [Psychroserpens algicola]|uniref:Lysophospholipid acyltransferase family protein n=1 Tax=Psychroserpens algicola TaxID=1719034 RepID=A0ABT0HB93_9FLAO|nr:lysophospholipid acyltransferase family protein [Psychroserpens algicola]MCK8481633.1 lysophospholipid acyltransferase family protein [Psychroserpens algicola]